MPITANAIIANEASTTMSTKSNIEALSSSVDIANRVMTASLVAAAVAAIIVAVSTILVIRWQGKLDILKDAEFATYKVEAGKTVAEAGRSAAEANKKAADANRQAETERLERLKLEAVIAPRSLSLVQQLEIIAALSPFSGKSVSVSTYALDADAASLGLQLVAVLQKAGLNVQNGIASIMPLGGFSVGVHLSGRNSALVDALQNALRNDGKLFVAPSETANAGGAGMMAGSPNQQAPDATVLIGTKPLPMIGSSQ